MRAVLPLIFVLSLLGAYCGYAIIAGTAIERDGVSMVPGMRSALPR